MAIIDKLKLWWDAKRASAVSALGLVLTLGIAAAGCGSKQETAKGQTLIVSKQDTIKGQVFIVTQGRANVKLGLVTVALFSEAAVRDHIAARQAVANANRAALPSKVSEAKAALETAQAKYENALRVANAQEAAFDKRLAEYESVLEEIQVGKAGARESLDKPPSPESLRVRAHSSRLAEERSLKEVRRRAGALVALQSGSEVWDSGAYYFSDLPMPLATAQTNADGEFLIKVPPQGHFVLAARAQRHVFGATEDYFWLVRIPENARQ